MLDLLIGGLVVLLEEGVAGLYHLIKAPQEHPEVVIWKTSNERAWYGARVVVPSQISHGGGCAVRLRVPPFLWLGGCEGVAVCWLTSRCCIDGVHGLDRFDLWPYGIIITSCRRQWHLLTSHWCCAFHSGKYIELFYVGKPSSP